MSEGKREVTPGFLFDSENIEAVTEKRKNRKGRKS